MALTDDFNGADGALSSPWSTDAVLALGGQVISNTAGVGSAGDALSYRSDSAVNSSRVKISATGGRDIGPAIHCNNLGSCYFVTNYTGTQIDLYLLLTGTSYTALTGAAVNYAVNDQIRIYRDAGDVVVTRNGSEIIRYADATLAGGYPGIKFYDNTSRLDDWTDDDSGSGLPTLTDVDTDEAVYDGQALVAVTGANLGTTNADRTFTLRQGSTSVAQVEAGTGTTTAATLNIAIEQSGADIKFGTALLRATRASDSEYAEITITVNPPSAQAYVDLTTPNSTADNRITASSDLASGDQLHYRGVGGGAAPSGLTVNVDATFVFATGYTPQNFEVRIWDASDSTWGAWALQTLIPVGDTRVVRGRRKRRGGLTMDLTTKEMTGLDLEISKWFDMDMSSMGATPQVVLIGLVSETNTVFGFTWRKSKAIGLPTETDSALAATHSKAKVIGLSTETDSAFSAVHTKSKAIGLATETDTALSMVHSGQTVAIGLATETDSALAMTWRKAKAIGLATEIDSALTMTWRKTKAIGLATETNTALAMVAVRRYLIGIASETSSALAFTWRKLKAIGIATETDNALGVTSSSGGTPAASMWRRLRLGLGF